GRRDIYASTQSALDYLSRLSKRFDDDWLLALAAYNSGGGTVNKAIRKNKKRHQETDYWSLNLPKETLSYVPRLLAIADILANAEKYGVELIDIPNQPQFNAIDTGSQLDLALAAEMAEMTIEELYKFNPGFNRWSTDPEGPHRLLIPVAKSEGFKEKLAKRPSNKRVKWTRHRIRSRETLSHIADRYNTSVAVIKKVNDIHGHSIRAGKHLLIPTSTQSLTHYSLSQPQRNLAKLSANRKGHKQIHTVKSGDTLWDIARSHSISTRQLASWNNMAPRDTLKLGQKLAIWTKSSRNKNASPINPFKSINYTVRSGDSLYLIARKFNVSIPDLRKWNRKRIGKYLKPGQRLKVNVDITKPTA
ncbi:MAG: lytic transglycosylase, partial [Gammaproteobacteria bacterium]